jgi:hypothetical protein
MDAFVRHNHFGVLYPILRCVLYIVLVRAFIQLEESRIMAIGLGLPEDTLINQHKFEDESQSSGALFTSRCDLIAV